MNSAAVDEFVAGIAQADISTRVFHANAVLDATVPNWRYQVRGAAEVQAELTKWYAAPGRFEALQRTGLPDGELVQFTLCWTEEGVVHTCHQAHILQVQHDRVIRDTVWCGGRWPAGLVAEMEALRCTPLAGRVLDAAEYGTARTGKFPAVRTAEGRPRYRAFAQPTR